MIDARGKDRRQQWLRRRGGLLLAIGALIGCTGFVGCQRLSRSTQAQSNKSASMHSRYSLRKTTTECLCVRSLDDVPALTSAVSTSPAETDLVSNGRAVRLIHGTSLKPFDTDHDVTSVLVESGDHTGELCHLLTKYTE